MKDYRRRQALQTIVGYTDMRYFLDYRDGVKTRIDVSSVPGKYQTPVKIVICNHHKKQ